MTIKAWQRSIKNEHDIVTYTGWDTSFFVRWMFLGKQEKSCVEQLFRLHAPSNLTFDSESCIFPRHAAIIELQNILSNIFQNFR